MKKRIFVIFALLLVASLALASCDFGGSDLQQINDALKQNYSKVQILVNTKSQSGEYNGKFTVTYGDETRVEYEVEQANTFEIGDDGSITVPDGDFIVKKSGVVVVRDGKVVEGDVDVALPDETGVFVGGLSFKEAFFINVSNQNARFEADVVDAQNFTGNAAFVCQDMHVVVVRNLNSKSLTSIELAYFASNGAEVTITYLFTK